MHGSPQHNTLQGSSLPRDYNSLMQVMQPHTQQHTELHKGDTKHGITLRPSAGPQPLGSVPTHTHKMDAALWLTPHWPQRRLLPSPHQQSHPHSVPDPRPPPDPGGRCHPLLHCRPTEAHHTGRPGRLVWTRGQRTGPPGLADRCASLQR